MHLANTKKILIPQTKTVRLVIIILFHGLIFLIHRLISIDFYSQEKAQKTEKVKYLLIKTQSKGQGEGLATKGKAKYTALCPQGISKTRTSPWNTSLTNSSAQY